MNNSEPISSYFIRCVTNIGKLKSFDTVEGALKAINASVKIDSLYQLFVLTDREAQDLEYKNQLELLKKSKKNTRDGSDLRM